MRRTTRWLLLAAAGAVLAVLALQTLVLSGPGEARADSQCAVTCNATHDQCLKTTNDRYTCDSQRNQCLKTCSQG